MRKGINFYVSVAGTPNLLHTLQQEFKQYFVLESM
jgi:hypothetical protein